jgi:hypothetical protein
LFDKKGKEHAGRNLLHASKPSGEVSGIVGDEEGSVHRSGTFEELIISRVQSDGERLGSFHERHMRIEDAYGRLKRLKM